MRLLGMVAVSFLVYFRPLTQKNLHSLFQPTERMPVAVLTYCRRQNYLVIFCSTQIIAGNYSIGNTVSAVEVDNLRL